MFDTKNIEFSCFDIKRDIKLPRCWSKELAEYVGIHIGDGCIGQYKTTNGRGYDYLIQYGGDPIKEKEYVDNFVVPLLKKLFGINIYPKKLKSGVYGFKIKSKAILQFFSKIIKLPVGNKGQIGIPKAIKRDHKLLKACVRGIFDTDFGICFHKDRKGHPKYPRITAWFKSEKLVDDLYHFFVSEGFKPYVRKNVQLKCSNGKLCNNHNIALSGREALKSWFKRIGSHNPKHLNKYRNWKRV
jgi:hypothetical protein